jgi:hypothetical protein
MLPFLTPALDGGEWSDSCASCFSPREAVHGTHCIGGWVGLGASLVIMGKLSP